MRAAVIGLALLAAACAPVATQSAPPATPTPAPKSTPTAAPVEPRATPWQPVPAPTEECGEVIAIGDSIIGATGSGHGGDFIGCAITHVEGINGSAPCQWLLFGWLTAALDAHPDADTVVAHFLPNDWLCATWEDPDFLAKNEGWLGVIKDIVEGRGMRFAPVVPAPSDAGCTPPAQSQRSAIWRQWAEHVASLPGAIDLRPWFGGDTFTRDFELPTGEIVQARAPFDCVHFSAWGYQQVGAIIRAGL